ncbi:hypothetical protein HZA73_03935 [candidate division TA06 bacterium]|nr:hypothetical protein [candidate division TA06 bacterium]
MKQHVFLCMLMVSLAFYGCSKDSVPTETPLVPGTSTIITGTVKDSSGNPIDSAAIKVKYFFTAVAKQKAKTDPCSLVSFTASRITNGVQLNWSTDYESSTYRWDIERSVWLDMGFVKIGEIAAAGTTSSTVNYIYIDSTTASDTSYYFRLCLIDVSGAKYYYGPVWLGGPIPIPHDAFYPARPCPFYLNTSFYYSLAGSSQTSLLIKQNDKTVKTLVNQTSVAGSYLIAWNGLNDSSITLASGYFVSELTLARHDSTFKYTKPVFINIIDSSSTRVNACSDAQGAFTISDLPIDSLFNMTDAMGTDLGNVKVCDSVTVYAVKNGYTANKVTFVLGKNTTSTIDFILR